MSVTGYLDLSVKRNAPYLETIEFEGLDFTGDTGTKLQVRSHKGAADPADLTLTIQSAGTEGLSWSVATVEGVVISTLTIDIDEATIDALLPASTNGQKAGTDVARYYDLLGTAVGLIRDRLLEGRFNILEGVTV